MGRRAARALHIALSAFGAVLFALFVIPRWWVLTGDIPAPAAIAGRIAAGLVIGAAAVPVALSLKSSLHPKADIPELALRLRAWSALLHVVAGGLITVTAVAEIWLGLQGAGPWLFGIYGAAGAVACLGVLGFVLSFSAEKPPAPPKAPKAKAEKTPKKRRKRGDSEAGDSREAGAEAESETEAEADAESESEAEAAPESESESQVESGAESGTEGESTDEPAAEQGALRNKRPTGKNRHRLRR